MELPTIQGKPVSALKSAAVPKNEASVSSKSTLKKRPKTDVVGLGMGKCGVAGVPAIRLRKGKDGGLEILAAEILNLSNELPETEQAAASDMTRWTLPRPFQAPHAALAIFSPQASLRHTEENLTEGKSGDGGMLRFVSRETAKGVPPLVASIPEYQAVWASRLLPEGHRPTACSLQLAGTATMNGLMSYLGKENVVAFLVFPFSVALVAFHDGQLVFYREYGGGQTEIRETLMSSMHVDAAMAESVLNDTFVDPTSMIEPILRPLFRQADIATDYLQRRRNCSISRFVVCGLMSGRKYWSGIFEGMMSHPLVEVAPNEGLKWAAHPLQKAPENFAETLPLYAAAIGAARAVLEDE